MKTKTTPPWHPIPQFLMQPGPGANVENNHLSKAPAVGLDCPYRETDTAVTAAIRGDLEAAKRTTALDSVLTKAEWTQLMQAAANGKDQVILCLGVLGLRASEIAACRREWVDLAQLTIHLPTEATKRKKGRVIPYGKLRVVKDAVGAFFVIERQVGLSRISVYQRVKRMASRAEITHPITPHGLRATGACWMAQAGYSITGLMAHFGWSEIKTAQHYIAATGASAMRDMNLLGDKVI